MAAARERLDGVMTRDPRMPEARAMLGRWYQRAIGGALDAGRRQQATTLAREGAERLPEMQAQFAQLLAGG